MIHGWELWFSVYEHEHSIDTHTVDNVNYNLGETDEGFLALFYMTGDSRNGGVFRLNTQESGNGHCMFPLWCRSFSCWSAPFLCQCWTPTSRTLARDKLVLDTLRKKYGYIPPSEVRRIAERTNVLFGQLNLTISYNATQILFGHLYRSAGSYFYLVLVLQITYSNITQNRGTGSYYKIMNLNFIK